MICGNQNFLQFGQNFLQSTVEFLVKEVGEKRENTIPALLELLVRALTRKMGGLCSNLCALPHPR